MSGPILSALTEAPPGLAWPARTREAIAGPQPITTLQPKPDTSYLLFCPEQGGWHTGEWWNVEGAGRWIAVIDTESELYPTHWMSAPADPSEFGPD